MTAAPTILAAVFSSGIFWSRTTVDLLAWSLFEGLIAVAAMRYLWAESDDPAPNPLAPRILALLLYCAAGLFGSQNIHATLSALLKILSLYMICSVGRFHRSDWKRAVERSVIAFSLLGATASIFKSAGLTGPMLHANLLSGFLTIGVVVCLHRALQYPGTKGGKAALAGWAWILFAQLELSSLAPFLASAAAGIGMLLFARRRNALIWIVLPAIVVAAFLFGRDAPNMILRKFADPHATERAAIWTDSWKLIRAHPWTGTGAGTFRDHYPEVKSMEGLRLAPYAHSEPINILCELGVFGIAIIIWALWPAIEALRRRKSWEEPWAWILTAAALQALVDFNLRYAPIYFVAAFALAQIRADAPEVPVRGRNRIPMTLAFGFLGALSILPGAAEFSFRWNTRSGSPVPRAEAARFAARIDPLNANWRMESGRMRDILIGIDLEPRNVWLKQAAARFYWNDWKKTGDPVSLREAAEQFRRIRELAPNAGIAEGEIDKKIDPKPQNGKFLPSIDNP